MERRNFFKICSQGIGLALVGKLTGCGKRGLPFSSSKKNPYEYDIDIFKTVNPDLIVFKEAGAINIKEKPLKGIASDHKDRIFVIAGNTVLIMDTYGSIINQFNTDMNADCIAVDNGEKVFLGIKEHVEVWGSDGNCKASWSSLSENAKITSLAVNNNLVAITDFGNKLLWLFNRSGSLIKIIGQKKSQNTPVFLVPSPFFDSNFSPEGILWVTNPGKQRIESYSLEGNFIKSFGEASMSIEGFSGCCNPTHFCFLPNGDFITVEKGLIRVKQYDRNGKFKGVVAAPDQFQEGMTGVDVTSDSSGRIYVLDTSQNRVRVFEKKGNK